MSLGTAKESRVEPGLRHMQHKAAHSPFVSALVDSHRTCDKVVARMQLISERREVASSHITKRNLLKRRSLLSLADKAQSIQLTGGRVGASSAAIFESILQACYILQPPAKPIQPRGSLSYLALLGNRRLRTAQKGSGGRCAYVFVSFRSFQVFQRS